MFDKLTPNYYVGEMYIELLDADAETAQMNATEFNRILETLYDTPAINHPLIIKLRNQYVRFEPNEDVPRNTLQISEETFENVGYTIVPSLQSVLLPTKNCLQVFNQMGFFPT